MLRPLLSSLSIHGSCFLPLVNTSHTAAGSGLVLGNRSLRPSLKLPPSVVCLALRAPAMASKLQLPAMKGTAAPAGLQKQSPAFLSGLALPCRGASAPPQRDPPLGLRSRLPRQPRVSASASSKQAQVRPQEMVPCGVAFAPLHSSGAAPGLPCLKGEPMCALVFLLAHEGDVLATTPPSCASMYCLFLWSSTVCSLCASELPA